MSVKKMISIILAITVVISVCAVPSANAATQYYINDTIDYSASPSPSVEGYNTAFSGWATTGTSNLNVNEGALEWSTSSYGNKNTCAVLAIPLTNAIDTTNGEFTVTVKAKLPKVATRRFRGFGILGGDLLATDGNLKNDNLMGLTQLDDNNYMMEAGNKPLWMNVKGSDGYYNIYTKTAADRYCLTTQDASESYYTYKWVVNPKTQTFRFYLQKDGDTDWIEPYANFYMKNTNTDDENDLFNEKGVFPTGTLPSQIKSIKFRQYEYNENNVANISTTYIKSITVLQKKPVLNCDWHMDGIQDLTVSSSKNGTTSVKAISDGIVQWDLGSDCTSNETITMNVDVEDFEVSNKNITVEFSAKFPKNYYKTTGFPVLVDNKGALHYVGFDSATPNNSSAALEQLAFRQLGARNFAKFDGGSTYISENKLTVETSANVQSKTFTDKTSVPSSNTYLNKRVRIGVQKQTDGTFSETGASAEYYDFKFVIDPVAKEYRYFQKANSSNEWQEIYSGVQGYPVQLEEVPSKICALQFKLTKGVNSSDSDSLLFKNISVYTDTVQSNTSGVAGRITGRTYSYDGSSIPTSTDNTTKAKIDVKITNYSTNAVNGKVICAVYNKDGQMAYVAVSQIDTINVGTSSYEFTNIPAAQAQWGDATTSQKTGVLSDENTYKIFIWDMENGLVPLANYETV